MTGISVEFGFFSSNRKPAGRRRLQSIDALAGTTPQQSRSSTFRRPSMSTLAVILSVWATVATCAALFIRGASPRLERATVSSERRSVQVSVTE